MWIRRIVATAAIFFPLAALGQTLDYVEEDPTLETGARVAVGLEKDIIPKTLAIFAEEELRVDDNFSHLQKSYTDLGIEYKVAPWLKAAVSYTLIANNSVSKGWYMRHRGAFTLTETIKSGRMKVAFREKIQATYRTDSVNLYQSPKTSWALKTRAKISYDLPMSPYTPYLSAEARFLLNGVNPEYFVYDSIDKRWTNPDPRYNDLYFNRLRITAGSTYKTPRRNSLDFFVVADLSYDLDIDFSSKGKQKKALQAQIDELNAQLPQLDSAIAAEKQDQKAKYDPIITELGTQKSQLQQRLKELKDLIAEADRTIESLKF